MLSSLTKTILRDLATELGPGGTSDSLTALKDALRKIPNPQHKRGVRYPFLGLLGQFRMAANRARSALRSASPAPWSALAFAA